MYLKIRASSWSLAKVILRCTVSETSKQRTCKFHKGQKISWLTKQLLASRVLCCKDRVWCLTTWRKHTPNCLATLHVFKKDTDRCATVPTDRELPSAFSVTICDSHICWQFTVTVFSYRFLYVRPKTDTPVWTFHRPHNLAWTYYRQA